MAALDFNQEGFSLFLKKPTQVSDIDLRDATVTKVIEEYEQFKRKGNPKYNLSSVKINIEKIEKQFGVSLMPAQITEEFWMHFYMFLSMNGLVPSTIKNYFDSIKRALEWGTRHNLTLSATYDQYKVSKYSKTKVALTPDEVSQIAHFDIRSVLLARFEEEKKEYVEEGKREITRLKAQKIQKLKKKIEKIKTYSWKEETKKKKIRAIQSIINLPFSQHFCDHVMFKIKTRLQKIAQKQVLRRIDTLEKVRDMFVLSCMLGQRHSDMIRINESNFSEDKNIFTCTQQKTGNKAVVDIKRYSMDAKLTRTILKRYNYTAPYKADISVYNSNLHCLLRLLEGNFNEEVKTENKIRGELVKEVRKKWQAVSSHTGRRTFVTWNVSRGISEILIRRCTGHSDSKSFNKYICLGDE